MLEVKPREQSKEAALFGGQEGEKKGLLLGTLSLSYGKCQMETKVMLESNYKHLLFKAETLDRKVVKKDLVEVRVRFSNIYNITYGISDIRIHMDEN